MIAPTHLHPRQDRYQEELKTQIGRSLEMEMKLQAEERQERARHLGIDRKIAEQHAERRQPSMTLAVKAMGYR